jgi:hypothetical protein
MKTRRNVFVCFLFALFLTACGGGDSGSGKKLLSKITSSDGTVKSYQYDSLNRVEIEIFTQTSYDTPFYSGKIEYSGKDPRPTRQTILITGAANIFEYGEDEHEGVITKYYQYQLSAPDDGHNNPGDPVRYYLNEWDRPIVNGFVGENGFYPSTAYSSFHVYDDRGNLSKKTVRGRTFLYLLPYEDICEYTYDNKKNPTSGTAMPRWWFFDEGNTNNILSASCTHSADGVITNSWDKSYSYAYDEDGYPVQRFMNGEPVEKYEYTPAH